MEDLYGWLIVFAGGAIGLLGTFLFASERELKEKRRECEELRASYTAEAHHGFGPAEPSENKASAELMAENKELLDQISSLSSRLEQSQRTVGEVRDEQERVLFECRSEKQRLSAANEQYQQEVEDLRSQLQTNEALLSQTASQREESAGREAQLQSELGELKGQTERLMEQFDSVSNKLSASERSIEELQTMHRDAQSEDQRLQAANLELQQRNAEMTKQLQQRDARLAELTQYGDESAARCTELQCEIADLKKQTDESRAKARDFEAAQEQLANVESRESIFKERQRELEAQVEDLQRELTAGSDRLQQLEAACQNLAAAEKACKELREQNLRLEEEISNGQGRLAAREENQRELAQLRQQLEEFKTRQPSLADRNGPVPEATRTIELPQESVAPAFNQVASTSGENVSSERGAPIVDLNEHDGSPAQLNSDSCAPVIQGANGGAIKTALGDLAKRKRHSRLVPAGLVLVLMGVVAAGFLTTRSSEKLAAVSEPVVDEPTATIEPSLTPQETKPAPSLRGAFRITRPTRVYSGPSEQTALVANIGPGMKINVVDSRDGWLEIRSRHGRPPGFVRQEAAVRIDQK
jgi:SMC interacting uncharacterized protein involved in chromosome segregation